MRKNNKNKKVIEQARIYLKQIQNEKEQLEQQDKDKNLFYTSFIHEIKIPLSIIRNSLNVYQPTVPGLRIMYHPNLLELPTRNCLKRLMIKINIQY